MISDSGDLKSRIAFLPYVCQFPWQTRHYSESWSNSICTVVGFCSVQSFRTPGRSFFVQSRRSTLLCVESFSVHDVFATHQARGLARSGCLSEFSASQALSHWDSQQNI